jgi:holin-like protein
VREKYRVKEHVMTLRKLWVSPRHSLRHSRLLQGALFAGFWAVGEALTRVLHLPVPGGLVGLALVLTLLVSGLLKKASLRRGAELLLGEMLLFFVPAVLAVLDHREFLGLLGLKLLAVVLAGTLAVMGATGLTIDLCCRFSPARVRNERR